jgi:phasin family protein
MPNPHRTASDATNRAAEDVRQAVDTAQETLRSGLSATSESVHRMSDQFGQAFSFSGKQSEELARQATQNLEAMTRASTVLLHGMQDLTREWMEFTQTGLRRNLDGLTALARCRSWQDLVSLQSGLVRDNLQQMIEETRRIAERSVQVADEATRSITARAQEGATRIVR